MEDNTNKHDSFALDINMPSQTTSGMWRLLAEVKHKKLRSRILTKIFGEQHDIIIIMPSRCVDNVVFNRKPSVPFNYKKDEQAHKKYQ